MAHLYRLSVVLVLTVLGVPDVQAQPMNTASQGGSVDPRPSREGLDLFERKIRPALVQNCFKCHSGDPAKAKGNLVLDSRDGLRKGGISGPAIEPGHPEKSLLIEALKHEGLEMPPSGKLPDEVLESFESWVQMGAPDPRAGKAANPRNTIDMAAAKRYWGFQRPRFVPAPAVLNAQWPISDIDRHILAKLEQQGLRPVPDADRTTLIRRLTFDLIGLPPTPQEIDAFVNDPSTEAVAKVVDRLLGAPQFGERWGRHWLDVVRFAESTGKELNLPYRFAWRYRNYVIDAFKNDKPFDKFIVEQIAGDLLPAKTEAERNELLVATGFLALGPKSAVTRDPEQFKLDVIDDQIDVTGRAFLGLTIACARCHDHKFDPIPTTDYYALAGIFNSTDTLAGIKPGRRVATAQRLLPLAGTSAEVKLSTADSSKEAERQQQIAKIQQQISNLQKQQRAGKQRPAMPNAGMKQQLLRQASAMQQNLQRGAVRQQIKGLEDRLDELEGATTGSGNLAIGVRDADTPTNARVLVRGELKEKGPVVPRGVPTVLQTVMTSHMNPRSSGRFQLANWIADKNNPLTYRVMANRVWANLFGRGLVDTVDNFGALGNEPSHPELLDALALQLAEQNGSIKALIRSIVLSRVYQLSSTHDAHNYEKDPENQYHWRMSRRRLDAEEIRDAMLMVSGQLALERPEGSPVMHLTNLPVGRGGKEMQEVRRPSNVRSVYLPMLRGLVPEMLGTFDMADPNLIVGKRDVTTVPTQALFLMNNPFVLNQSRETAKRILGQQGLSQNGRIELAYRLAVGRPPTEPEHAEATNFLASFRKAFEEANQAGNPQVAAWASFCQVLFQSGLFRYVY